MKPKVKIKTLKKIFKKNNKFIIRFRININININI